MTPERAQKASVIMRYINNTDRTPIGVKFLPLYETVGLSPEQENAFQEFDAIYSLALRSPFRDTLDKTVKPQFEDDAAHPIEKAKRKLQDIKSHLGNVAFNIAVSLCQLETLSPSTTAFTASDVKTIDKVANKLIRYFQ